MSKDIPVKANEAKPKVNIFKKIGRFFKDLKSEFKKIVWPTKKQVMHNTGVVLVFMGVTAIAIWGLDSLLVYVRTLIFG